LGDGDAQRAIPGQYIVLDRILRQQLEGKGGEIIVVRPFFGNVNIEGFSKADLLHFQIIDAKLKLVMKTDEIGGVGGKGGAEKFRQAYKIFLCLLRIHRYQGFQGTKRVEKKIDSSLIVYPGPLFGSTFQDLEETAKGETRGFYIISFDKQILDCKFVEIKVAEILYKEIVSVKWNSEILEAEIMKNISELEVKNKIVLIKVKGKLLGKRSNIDFGKFSIDISKREALLSFINTNNLSTDEASAIVVQSDNKFDIEREIFHKSIKNFQADSTVSHKVKNQVNSKLTGKTGESASLSLLDVLRNEKLENENASTYDDRVISYAKSIFDSEGYFYDN